MAYHSTLTRSPAQSLGRNLAIVLCAAALITLCAKLRVPSWPVPMTLHTLAVMAIAVSFGPRMAVASFGAYMAAGMAGLPVFSGSPERGIGLAYIMGPTGGYLIGYWVASYVTGAMAAGRGALGKTLAMLAGLAVTYALGLLWLANFVPAAEVVSAGFTPFILGDLINIAMVTLGSCLLPTALLAKLRA